MSQFESFRPSDKAARGFKGPPHLSPRRKPVFPGCFGHPPIYRSTVGFMRSSLHVTVVVDEAPRCLSCDILSNTNSWSIELIVS